MRAPGNALALLAIAVGATVQLTATSGPFSLWSTMVGLLLLSAIVAYRDEIGFGAWTELAFSLITGYVLLYVFGFLIDNYVVPSKKADLTCPLLERVTVEEVEKCIIDKRDIIMFCSWIVLSVLA